MRIRCLLVAVVLLGACGGDATISDMDSGLVRDASSGRDANAAPPDGTLVDATSPIDSSAPFDSSASFDSSLVSDAEALPDAEQLFDASNLDADLADANVIENDADIAVDASIRRDGGIVTRRDAGTPGIILGPVQCRVNADCAGPAASCQRTAPGGVCMGCADGTCPSGTYCSDFGSCIRECETDTDCNLGMQCLRSGLCGIRTCSESEPCPEPYVCGATGRCARPLCGRDTLCPAPLRCSVTVCVEP